MDRNFRSFFTSGGGGVGTETDPIAIDRLVFKLRGSGLLLPNSRNIPDNAQSPCLWILPSSPANLTTIEWKASPTPFSTYRLEIQPTDKWINGSNSPILITTDGECGSLVYFEDINEWVIYRDGVAAGGAGGAYAASRISTGLVPVKQNQQAVVNSQHVFIAPADVVLPDFQIDSVVGFSVSEALGETFNEARLTPLPGETIQVGTQLVSAGNYVIVQRNYPDFVLFKRVANGWRQI